MQSKVILLNGPPRSGKDYAANILMNDIDDAYFTVLERYSLPLKHAVLALINVFSLDDPLAIELESKKDEPYHLFRGKTYRQMQIGLSEQFIKPFVGQQQFGHWLVHRIKGHEQFSKSYYGDAPIAFVVPDSGFAHEAIPVIDYVGEENVLLIQITRDGTNFDNDSRSYITLPNIHTIEVHNQGDEAYRNTILKAVNKWLTT